MDCSISCLFETLIQGEKLKLYTPSKDKEKKKQITKRYTIEMKKIWNYNWMVVK